MRAALELLSTAGPVCTDDQTRGDTLAVFREMIVAPHASRVDLRWHQPEPLRPVQKITAHDIKRSELDEDQLKLIEPGAHPVELDAALQRQLNSRARAMARNIGIEDEGVQLRRSWVPASVTVRWWPLNRMTASCSPRFEISDPVRDRNLAFLAVRSGHWGTLYALEQKGDRWRITAEWSRWLY